jgi:GT2 family glycosyltransferase
MTFSAQPTVFVIVLNFNGKSVLPACLSSIYQSDYPNFEVVVVDNASIDDSFKSAIKSFSKTAFIKNPANLGFAKGNNIGIRYALERFADYIFLLNNDTVIEKNTLSMLVNTLDKNASTGIVSPLIFNNNGTLWFAGGSIDWLKMQARNLFQPISNSPYATAYLSGCAMLVRKEVFKKIGLFDERFFLYYEDTDFSLRAQKSGFKLLIVPNAHIRHLEQSNVKNTAKIYWLVLSGLIFFHTHASFWQKRWITVYVFGRKIKNRYDLFFTKSEVARNVRKAYIDFEKKFNA